MSIEAMPDWKDKNLLQIMPADGWFAVLRPRVKGKEPGGPEMVMRLIAWGLYEIVWLDGESQREIRGIGPDGFDVEIMHTFDGYVHERDVEWICKTCWVLDDCEHRPKEETP